MNTRHQKIDRVTIMGKREESDRAFKYCEKHGYCITRSGPMWLSVTDVDLSRFKIVAEKRL